MSYFDHKTVLITGGARGIGFATASLLGVQGANIVITDILEDRLHEAVERLSSQGIKAISVVSDVSSFSNCESAVKKTVDTFGSLDILVNNAGISIVANLEECKAEVCRKLIEVNLIGAINMTIASLEHIKKAKGHIIFVSSVSGIRSIPTGSIYGASKSALRSFAEAIRLELKPYGVHVGVISPGFTTTDPSKTVMKGDGTPRPINRPPHDTPEGVARGIARLIEKRKREIVLTPLGKLTYLLQRLSPSLLDYLLKGHEIQN